MKIGIMGGTFDPIHNGHLMLGEYARRDYLLDEVWYMPNGNPPHKSESHIREMTLHRIKMTELAIKDIPYFKLCTYEAERKETSYSYKTMEAFRKLYPENQFYFIIGADSLFSMQYWFHPERLIPIVTILAAYRDDADTPEEMEEQIHLLNKKYHGDIRLLRTPILPISSSDIREKLKAGISCDSELPPDTAKYIEKYHIYQGE